MNASVRLLRDNRAFRTLWSAEVISLAGDWLSFVAVSVLALDQGEGALALALVLALHTLPHAIVSPIAGLLADRVDARRLLRAGALVEGGLTLAMAWAALRGALGAVQVLVLLRATVSALVYPAWGVALRHVVPDRDLVRAHALSAATWSVMFTVGMAIGGLLTLLGPATALVLDAGTFALSAALLSRLPALPAPGRASARDGVSRGVSEGAVEALTEALTAMPGAWRLTRLDRILGRATRAKATLALAGAGAWLLVQLDVAWLTQGLGSGVAVGLGVGLIHALRGVGTGVGPVLVAERLGDRAPGLGWLRASQLTMAVGVALTALSPWPALALLGVLVWGVGTGANWTVSSALLQLRAPRAWLGRVSALDGAARTLSLSGGVVAAAALVDAGGSPRAVALGCLGLALLVALLEEIGYGARTTAATATAGSSPGLP